MLKQIVELVDILKEELRLQKEMGALCEKKKDALVKNDMERLEEIIRLEERHLIPLGETGLKRMRMTEQLGKMLSLPEAKVSIGHIAAHAPEPHRGELHLLRSELKKIIGDVMAANRTNKALTENSAGQVREFLMILAGRHEGDSLYTRKGLAAATDVQRLVIDHIA